MTRKTANKFRQPAEELGIGGTMMSLPTNMTALRCVMLNTQQRAEEFGVRGTMMSLPTTTKWQQKAPP